MELLVVIPARGGSKGIPRKNLARVGGRTLLARSIAAAGSSVYRPRIVVSTDDDAIADEARRAGALVIRRPAGISGDNASSEMALTHVLDTLEREERYRPEVLVFLQCTSPFTTGGDIDGVVDLIVREGADSALAVAPFHYFVWRPAGDAGWAGINHDKRVRPMRQQREPEYLETGSVYAMRVDGFRTHRHRFFGRTLAHVVPSRRQLEIDEPEDLERAEAMAQTIERRGACPDVRGVRAVVFDFDGVMTDDCVTIHQDGSESVRCSRSDGYGIGLLLRAAYPTLILSKERNPVVAARGAKLGVPVLQGIDDKRTALEAWCRELGVEPADVAYLGNDVNDLGCLRLVGFPFAVADARPEVKAAACHVLAARGGSGAVRELADLILTSRQDSSMREPS